MTRKRRRARYVMNNESFGEFLMSKQVLRPVRQIGGAMVARGRRLAPRSGDGEGLPYADGFGMGVIPEGIVAGKYRNRRVAISVFNTTRHGPVVEFGKNDGMGGKTYRGKRILLRAGLHYGSLARKKAGTTGWGG